MASNHNYRARTVPNYSTLLYFIQDSNIRWLIEMNYLSEQHVQQLGVSNRRVQLHALRLAGYLIRSLDSLGMMLSAPVPQPASNARYSKS